VDFAARYVLLIAYRLAAPSADIMDLRHATENVNGRLLMKIGALVCFLLAGALLFASLFVPPPAQYGMSNGDMQGATASLR
jgi:hypothetical protein